MTATRELALKLASLANAIDNDPEGDSDYIRRLETETTEALRRAIQEA